MATKKLSVALAALTTPTFTAAVTMPLPVLVATALTTTATKLNYLTSITGVTGTATSNVVLSASPTIVSPTVTTAATLPAATTIGTVTAAEIGYLSGVTSAIQTQFGTKAPLANPTFTGTVTVASELRISSPGAGIFGSLLDAAIQKIESGSTAGYRTAVEVYGGSATPANTIIFKTGSAEIARMNITGLSIGGITPTHLLDVYKTSGQAAAVIGSGASGDAVLILDASNGDGAGGDYFTLSHLRSGNLLALGYGANQFCINSSGNIGIGFSSQASKVAINGGLHVGAETDAGDNNILADGVIRSVGDVVAYYSA